MGASRRPHFFNLNSRGKKMTTRAFMWFMIGVLVVAMPMCAHAETIAATPSSTQVTLWYIVGSPENKVQADTPYQACPLLGWYGYTGSGSCRNQAYTVTAQITTTTGYTYSCPSGQNWTLSGQSCTRPDCTPPEVRNTETGVCGSPPGCTRSPNEKIGDNYRITWPLASGVGFCVDKCQAYAASPRNKTGGKATVEMYVNGPGQSGSNCTVGGNEITPNVESEPTMTPTPCAPGQGSYTSPGGVVMCVAGTTPNATVPPVVTKKSDVTDYSDGSKKTVTTISTCTGDGACSTNITTTVTNATNGQPGQAGTPGTGEQKLNKPSEETSDFCAKNPTLQFCKGGMNEEVTQKKVLTELERFNNPTATDDGELTIQKNFLPSESQTEFEDVLKDTVQGIALNPSIEQNKSAWVTAMESGWITPITLTGCQPIVSNFAGRSWTLDHCPVAEKISSIGAYALWFMFAVSMFVMLTGGRGN